MSVRPLVIAVGVLLLTFLVSAHAATPRTPVAKIERVSNGETETVGAT